MHRSIYTGVCTGDGDDDGGDDEIYFNVLGGKLSIKDSSSIHRLISIITTMDKKYQWTNTQYIEEKTVYILHCPIVKCNIMTAS